MRNDKIEYKKIDELIRKKIYKPSVKFNNLSIAYLRNIYTVYCDVIREDCMRDKYDKILVVVGNEPSELLLDIQNCINFYEKNPNLDVAINSFESKLINDMFVIRSILEYNDALDY